MDLLRSSGFLTAAMTLASDSIGIADGRLKSADKLALLLGTEGNGLTDETVRLADFSVKIPMFHGVDSLNVAAASAVAFWEVCGKGRVCPEEDGNVNKCAVKKHPKTDGSM
jgi:rRNA methylases